MSASQTSDSSLSTALSLASRLLLALLFLPAGLMKVASFSGTVGYIASAGLPVPTVAAVVAIVIEVGLGAAILLGYKTRLAALGLAAFTFVASIGFHAFWAVPADQAMVQQLMFFKNLGVIGGLLALGAFGAGKLSLDARASAR